MTTLQEQARALGDPTRHRIFQYVAEAARAVDVAELTSHFGLNHNAIRQHLAKLVDAELLLAGTIPSTGRGRPRLSYRLSPAVHARWGVEAPYERLSLLLAEMVTSGDDAVEVGRRSGVRSVTPAAAPEAEAGGAGSAPQSTAPGSNAPVDPLDVLVAEMARHGFDPAVTEDGDRIEVVLRACPFVSTALAEPTTVCGLHLGIARGVAETVGGLSVDELDAHDPRRAGCRLRCHREPATTSHDSPATLSGRAGSDPPP